jgi:Flp pilus assembly protein TadB
MYELLSLILLIIAGYFFLLAIKFSNKQLETRILSYIEVSPKEHFSLMKSLKNFIRINFKKQVHKTVILDKHIAELADLLALALVAGRSPIQALDEIVDLVPDPLRIYLNEVLLKNASGIAFDKAMAQMAINQKSDSLSVLVKSLQIAAERGTPLAEILRSFSHELRNRSKEKILRSASKKEIAMLVPIVFVVLPTVLLIAIYPAIQVIKSLS